MDLKRTVKWIDKTEARDKFCKAIQYACRFLKYQYQQKGDKVNAERFNAMFGGMRDARKLFRLFKSMNQYQKMSELLAKEANFTPLILGLLTRIGFFLYWIFDNISILRKIKFIEGDPKTVAQKGATCWFLALLFTLIATIKSLIENIQKKQQSGALYKSSNDQKEIEAKRKSQLDCEKKIRDLIIVLIKTLGDMIPAAQGSQLLNKLGIPASDALCGIGGLISAVITCYQLYD